MIYQPLLPIEERYTSQEIGEAAYTYGTNGGFFFSQKSVREGLIRFGLHPERAAHEATKRVWCSD